MKKGVTPVVATVLLVTVTVATAGTMYGLTQSNIAIGQGNAEANLPLDIGALDVERCYQESGRTKIVVLNGGTKSINASKMNLILNGSVEDESDYTINPSLVEPQNVFTVNSSKIFGSETQVIMTNGDSSREHVCFNL